MAPGESQERDACRLALVIVNYRTPSLVIESLSALAAMRGAEPPFRVVVVDGGSGDDSAAQIAGAVAAQGWGDWVDVLPLEVNGGFGFANNRAILHLRDTGGVPPFVMLLNPDARARPGALAKLVETMDAVPQAGAVGARLEHEDGRPQSSAFTFPGVRGELCRGARLRLLERLLRQPPTTVTSDDLVRVDWVTGAAVLFRRDALEHVGLFDDGFFLYFEETELLWRMGQAGWQSWFQPAARVVHLGGVSTGLRDPETGLMAVRRTPDYWYRSRRLYAQRTGGAGRTLAMGVAWLAGHLLLRLRAGLIRKPTGLPANSLGDFVQLALMPRGEDKRTRPVTRLSDPVPAKPEWMDRAATIGTA